MLWSQADEQAKAGIIDALIKHMDPVSQSDVVEYPTNDVSNNVVSKEWLLPTRRQTKVIPKLERGGKVVKKMWARDVHVRMFDNVDAR